MRDRLKPIQGPPVKFWRDDNLASNGEKSVSATDATASADTARADKEGEEEDEFERMFREELEKGSEGGEEGDEEDELERMLREELEKD